MITILCPTRGRPDRVDHLVQTALTTAVGPVQFVFYVDDDDPAGINAVFRWARRIETGGTPNRVSVVIEPRYNRPMSDWWNACAEKAIGDIVMFTDDEAAFLTHGWDVVVRSIFERHPDHAVLVQPDDNVHGDADAGYFFVHWPTWRAIFGRLTPPHFSYGYADVWPMEVARAAGRKVFLPGVVIENLAPYLQPPDVTHEENAARAERDRPGDRYNATQDEREAEVLKLKTYIQAFNDELFARSGS